MLCKVLFIDYSSAPASLGRVVTIQLPLDYDLQKYFKEIMPSLTLDDAFGCFTYLAGTETPLTQIRKINISEPFPHLLVIVDICLNEPKRLSEIYNNLELGERVRSFILKTAMFDLKYQICGLSAEKIADRFSYKGIFSSGIRSREETSTYFCKLYDQKQVYVFTGNDKNPIPIKFFKDIRGIQQAENHVEQEIICVLEHDGCIIIVYETILVTYENIIDEHGFSYIATGNRKYDMHCMAPHGKLSPDIYLRRWTIFDTLGSEHLKNMKVFKILSKQENPSNIHDVALFFVEQDKSNCVRIFDNELEVSLQIHHSFQVSDRLTDILYLPELDLFVYSLEHSPFLFFTNQNSDESMDDILYTFDDKRDDTIVQLDLVRDRSTKINRYIISCLMKQDLFYVELQF